MSDEQKVKHSGAFDVYLQNTVTAARVIGRHLVAAAIVLGAAYVIGQIV